MSARFCYQDSTQEIAAPFSLDNAVIALGEEPPEGTIFMADSIPQLRKRYLLLTRRDQYGNRYWRSPLPAKARVVKHG